jgi:hypothetical protein
VAPFWQYDDVPLMPEYPLTSRACPPARIPLTGPIYRNLKIYRYICRYTLYWYMGPYRYRPALIMTHALGELQHSPSRWKTQASSACSSEQCRDSQLCIDKLISPSVICPSCGVIDLVCRGAAQPFGASKLTSSLHLLYRPDFSILVIIVIYTHNMSLLCPLCF